MGAPPRWGAHRRSHSRHPAKPGSGRTARQGPFRPSGEPACGRDLYRSHRSIGPLAVAEECERLDVSPGQLAEFTREPVGLFGPVPEFSEPQIRPPGPSYRRPSPRPPRRVAPRPRPRSDRAGRVRNGSREPSSLLPRAERTVRVGAPRRRRNWAQPDGERPGGPGEMQRPRKTLDPGLGLDSLACPPQSL